jgi:arginase
LFRRFAQYRALDAGSVLPGRYADDAAPGVLRNQKLSPYFQAADTVHAGCRDFDEHLAEVRGLLAMTVPARRIIAGPANTVASDIRAQVSRPDLAGYWLHLDVDILDAQVMPAVDSPDPGGLDAQQLTDLLAGLAPGAMGAQITVFDPDLDPDGEYAGLIVGILAEGLRHLGEDSRR